jgi:hypothetical protein
LRTRLGILLPRFAGVRAAIDREEDALLCDS